MESRIDYDYYIQRYLDGEMQNDEKFWFNRELEDDVELQYLFDLYQAVDATLKDTEVIEFREQLMEVEQDYFDRGQQLEKVRPVKIYKFGLIAATVMLLIGVGWFLMRQFQPYDKEEIYAEYYEPYQVTMRVRSADTEIEKMLAEALNKYEAGDYASALPVFEYVLSQDSTKIGVHLYSGISNMEIYEYEDAEESFDKIIEHQNNLFIEQAEWYLGFCYLMTDNEDKAIEQFSEISESTSFYRKPAGEIVRKLNR